MVQRVAVLLAAYNGIKWIEEQVATILSQENVFVQIFISVDLSSDNTYKWCKEIEDTNKNITVLKYGEQFGGAAPNFFRLIRDVDFSSFDYVALADQDDIWLDDKLITACTYIKKDDLSAYSSNVLAFWSDGRERVIDKAQTQRKYDYLFEAAGPGCSYVLQVKPLLEFKKFLSLNGDMIKQVVLHDWLIYAFFRTKGYKWFIDPKYQLRYRQHNDNQVGVNKGWNAVLKRLKLLHSGWYKKQVLLISELMEVNNANFKSRWEVLRNISQLRRSWQDRVMLFVLVLVGLY